jgi:hypothetical protein
VVLLVVDLAAGEAFVEDLLVIAAPPSWTEGV